MDRFVEVSGCPVPTVLVSAVRTVEQRAGAALVSCYRGQDPQALAIMHAHGKHSQAELWSAYLEGRGAEFGILGRPNPPGRSTHEQRSDGIAYPGPIGRALPPWEVGMDWPDAAIPAVMREFTRLGLAPVHPYAAGVEYHHINLRRAPVLFRVLKLGSTGPRVAVLTHRLRIVEQARHEPLIAHTGGFGPRVRHAVEQFQHEHGLLADGSVGPTTWRNLEAAARKAKAAHR